jgi:hypothetical protein
MVKNSFSTFSESHVNTEYIPAVIIESAIFGIPEVISRPEHTGVLYLCIDPQAVYLNLA